jgi:hypothetical protein
MPLIALPAQSTPREPLDQYCTQTPATDIAHEMALAYLRPTLSASHPASTEPKMPHAYQTPLKMESHLPGMM